MTSRAGKVRLLRPEELPPDWDPTTDPSLTAWEMVHHLIRALEAGGESAAAELAANSAPRPRSPANSATACTRYASARNAPAEALSYNSLVQSWPEITRLAREEQKAEAEQTSLFASEDTN